MASIDIAGGADDGDVEFHERLREACRANDGQRDPGVKIVRALKGGNADGPACVCRLIAMV
jgi:hypothetical protein